MMAATALVACGTASGGSPSPSASTSPSTLACTSSGSASATWPPADKAAATPAITAVDVNGNVVTFTFAQGTPAFELTTQRNTQFALDPSGQPVTLKGAQGVRIVMRGFRGDIQNYTGSKSTMSSGPVLRELYELGDSEGVVTWGAGVSAAACAAVTVSGSTLTVEFIYQPVA